jgi:FKBP-type peptidyl-prolyl cis-trans isomerase
MKSKYLVTICLLASGLTLARGQEVKFQIPGQTDSSAAPAASAPSTPGAQPAAAAPAAPKTSYTDAQLVEEFGWFIGKRVGLTELAFNKAEVDSLVKGLSTAAAGKDSPYELEKIGPAMDEFMQKKQSAYLAKLKDKNMADNMAFFTKLKENKNIVELPDGLRYEILKQGDGPTPKPTDTVKVHYTGTLTDGTVFDSSVQRGEPVEFGLADVIPGWTEGLQHINKGGKIKLYVPPHLGYGDDGKGSIPPGATLVFDVELLDIKAGTAAATPTMPTAPAATEKK